MGRLGLVWRRLKHFYADMLLLGVDVFRKNRPDDVEIPLAGENGIYDAKWIRLADLKGNIQAHPEADETFPRLKSQQRAVLQQLFGINDPVIQRALTEPANLGFIKNVIGLSELVVPGEDSRNKQLREIQQLLSSSPIVVPLAAPAAPSPSVAQHAANSRVIPSEESEANANNVIPSVYPGAGREESGANAAEEFGFDGNRATAHSPEPAPEVLILPSVPVDHLLDDHAVEFEECKRWANSDAGQAARMTNPAGFANVRAHAQAHLRALMTASPSVSGIDASTRFTR
jgi:hypothetical protein